MATSKHTRVRKPLSAGTKGTPTEKQERSAVTLGGLVIESPDRYWANYVLRIGDKYFADTPVLGTLTSDLSKALVSSNRRSMQKQAEIYQSLPALAPSQPPVLEVLVVTPSTGLVTGVRPLDSREDEGEVTPPSWSDCGPHTLALAETALFEKADGDQIYLHTSVMQNSPLWAVFMKRYEDELAAESVRGDREFAFRMLLGRMLYTGIVMGRREAGKRNRHGQLLFDNAINTEAVEQKT